MNDGPEVAESAHRIFRAFIEAAREKHAELTPGTEQPTALIVVPNRPALALSAADSVPRFAQDDNLLLCGLPQSSDATTARSMRYRGIVGPHAFGVFALMPTQSPGIPQSWDTWFANCGSMWTHFWSGEDQGRIQIDNLIARVATRFKASRKYCRICALPLGIGWRKKRPVVGGGDGAEECVGDGMEKDISVGVAAQALVVGKADASDDERDSGLELVQSQP